MKKLALLFWENGKRGSCMGILFSNLKTDMKFTVKCMKANTMEFICAFIPTGQKFREGSPWARRMVNGGSMIPMEFYSAKPTTPMTRDYDILSFNQLLLYIIHPEGSSCSRTRRPDFDRDNIFDCFR